MKVQERPIVFPSGDLFLEGLYHKGANGPGIVIGAPHPRYGGSMDNPVVAEIAYAAAREGRPTLRFNYRGVGASQGTHGAGAEETEDFRAAIAELRATTGREAIVAAGYSFGSARALEIARSEPGVVAAIFVSPPKTLFALDALRELRIPSLITGGTEDEMLDWPALRETASASPAVKIETIEGASHYFSRGLVALGSAVSEFLQRLTPP